MEQHHTRVLIIGAGPAGYTAAIYAARASLNPIMLMGPQPGGQLMITTDVENYPGFADTIQGPWLMEQMLKQAEHVGVKCHYDIVTDIDVSKRPFVCRTDRNVVYTADSVIICTGAQAKWLGLESEKKYRGFGVSACATCDGFFFKNKIVAVVGGGNAAVEEALYLTNHAASVVLIHRKDKLRAEKILQDRLLKNTKISVIWNREIHEVLGDNNPPSVTHLQLKDPLGALAEKIAVDGLFIAIGHSPMTQVFQGKIQLDLEGYIITNQRLETSVPGIYAAGDVQDKIYRQAVTAAGQGCMVALEIERFLANKEC
ncbi:MAG: thioredoxin-disulfide reductase [Alphaproteobacteria bacterium]|nr:thioredoxin-disulfide reductase [Alphaproteobacteria bacterium]OJV46432.1 MAG: thioredoxin-disulfide reductase [Alphaproteobacteria bacterium 43-37]